MTSKPERPVLLPSNTLHRRAFDDPDAKTTKCGLPIKEAGADQYARRLCKRCFGRD